MFGLLFVPKSEGDVFGLEVSEVIKEEFCSTFGKELIKGLSDEIVVSICVSSSLDSDELEEGER